MFKTIDLSKFIVLDIILKKKTQILNQVFYS